MNNFHALLNRNEHIELKSSVKSVAADQIKRACQDYWGAQAPPAPPHAKALKKPPKSDLTSCKLPTAQFSKGFSLLPSRTNAKTVTTNTNIYQYIESQKEVML